MARRSHPDVDFPWHVPVRLEEVSETGVTVSIEADARMREAIAKIAGLRSLDRLAAAFEVHRHSSNGLRVDGEVTAKVGQVCVVTLEPIDNEVREAVDVIFRPIRSATAGDNAGRSPDAPEIEALIDGTVDLGVMATEFLMLGIDPYPRKPNAVFEAPPLNEPASGPFDALAALKRGEVDKT